MDRDKLLFAVSRVSGDCRGDFTIVDGVHRVIGADTLSIVQICECADINVDTALQRVHSSINDKICILNLSSTGSRSA